MKTQQERIHQIEIEVNLSKQHRETMSKEITEIKNDVKEIKGQMEEIIEKLENKFAPKWVELVAKWLIGILTTGVVWALVAMVVNRPLH